jgi:hypothetical protein
MRASFLSLVLVSIPALASADKRDDGTHFGLRLGTTTLSLNAESDTPVLGSYFDRAAEAYALGASAYNAQHGAGSAPRMDESDMDLGAAMLLVTPQVEIGDGAYFVRLEAPFGFSSQVRTYGLGIYPLGLQVRLGNGGARAFLVSGATASYATFPGADEAHGALVTGRAAIGVRFASDEHYAFTVELGYGLFAVGGVVDFAALRDVEDYDPRGMAPPPTPGSIAQGGEQSGMIDFSLGFALP